MERDHDWEATVERRVKRHWQRRMLLVLNFAAFILYCAVLGASWNIDPFFRQLGMGWMVFVSLHTVWLLYTEWMEFAVRRALEQEQNAYYRAVAEQILNHSYAEKSKRDPYLALTGDESEDAVEFDEREYRKRR